jgi:hypothetical protein
LPFYRLSEFVLAELRYSKRCNDVPFARNSIPAIVGECGNPSKSYAAGAKANMVDELVRVAGICLNMALEAAANEPLPTNRVFSPQTG